MLSERHIIASMAASADSNQPVDQTAYRMLVETGTILETSLEKNEEGQLRALKLNPDSRLNVPLRSESQSNLKNS
jgi:hypothetical protein